MLPIFNYVEIPTANPKAKEVLETAKKKFGMLPNITKVMANNPFILKGWLEFNQYIEQGTPTVIFGGEEYGTGSSRDWAAKGTQLLGVKAVVVRSFERARPGVSD